MTTSNPVKTATIVAALTVLAGCASITDRPEANMQSATEIAAKERQIANQQEEINRLQRELRSSESRERERQATPAPTARSAGLFPPNPKAGECYARVLIPAKYSVTSETVMTKEAAERVEIVPARYETVEERVLLKEASTKLEIVPATYRTVEERVMVKPASKKIEEIPATYRTVTERVMVSPARTEWKPGPASSFGTRNVVDTRSTDTGEIMCLVEVPAVYKEVSRKVIAEPARTRTVEIPAEYKVVKKQVVAKPPTTREVTIPAEYGTMKKTRLVSPASEKRIAIPATYDTVSKRTKVSEEQLEWRQVVCDVNLNRGNIITLQKALQDKNLYDGPIDGIMGPKTIAGANSYARSNSLPTGENYIAQSVVAKLGLDF